VSRGGFGSKLHIVTDGHGLPVGAVLTRGNRNECPTFAPLMASVTLIRRRRRMPRKLAADKGYASGAIRRWLRHRRVEAVIPLRGNEYRKGPAPPFDAAAYRRRNVVERCVGRLKEMRRVGTRYEKLATNFMAMLTLAMIVLYLRLPGLLRSEP
jgi:transposase